MKFRTFLMLAGALALIAGVWGGAAALGGYIDVAASNEHNAATRWLLHGSYRRAVSRNAAEISAPEDLGNDARVLVGARNFDAMCSACHTPPGLGDTPVAQGLNPAPPKLVKLAAPWSDEELFWVIRHGAKMTGMPAFGPSHEDSELWALAGFLRKMQGGTAAAYQRWVRRAAAELGSADDGHDHRHGNEGTGGKADGQHDPDGGHDNADGHHDQDGGHDNSDGHHDKDGGHDNSDGHHDEDGGHDNSDGHHGELAPSNPPERIVAAFTRALAAEDRDAALALLHPELLVFETGAAEISRDEYAGHHLPHDMAFMAKATLTPLSRRSRIAGDQAWVATRSRLQAEHEGKSLDLTNTETMVLERSDKDWRIAHIHWSTSRP